MAVNMYTILALAAVLAPVASQETIHARCTLEPTGDNRVIGYVDFIDHPLYGLYVDVIIQDAEPGTHGVHVHTYGDLSDKATGTATGGHYNPYAEEHGCYPGPRKVGDMGNVIVNADGKGQYVELENSLMRLRGETNVLGRGLIFHMLEDNCVRTPAGDVSAGPRQAQCVIGRVKPDAAKTRLVLAAWKDRARAKQILGIVNGTLL